MLTYPAMAADLCFGGPLEIVGIAALVGPFASLSKYALSGTS